MLVVLGRLVLFFFFQAEDGIRDGHVTGVQTCALPISVTASNEWLSSPRASASPTRNSRRARTSGGSASARRRASAIKIGRASCRERGEGAGGGGAVKKKERGTRGGSTAGTIAWARLEL